MKTYDQFLAESMNTTQRDKLKSLFAASIAKFGDTMTVNDYAAVVAELFFEQWGKPNLSTFNRIFKNVQDKMTDLDESCNDVIHEAYKAVVDGIEIVSSKPNISYGDGDVLTPKNIVKELKGEGLTVYKLKYFNDAMNKHVVAYSKDKDDNVVTLKVWSVFGSFETKPIVAY